MSIGRIESITPCGKSVLAITWEDGRRAEIDLGPIIAVHPQLAPLADPDDFPVASEDRWSIEWPQCGIDLGAAQLRRWADEQAGEAMPAERFRA